MMEEGTAENLTSAASEKQNQLVRKFCVEADSILAQAADYDSAFRLKESLCRRFEEECESSIIVAATSRHLDNLLKERWAKQPSGLLMVGGINRRK